MDAQELVRSIQQRIAIYAQRSNPDAVGPLKYSGSWQRRAHDDAIRIEELRWLEAEIAQRLAAESAA